MVCTAPRATCTVRRTPSVDCVASARSAEYWACGATCRERRVQRVQCTVHRVRSVQRARWCGGGAVWMPQTAPYKVRGGQCAGVRALPCAMPPLPPAVVPANVTCKPPHFPGNGPQGSPPLRRGSRRLHWTTPTFPRWTPTLPWRCRHPPLQGLVSPQNVELSACTKGSIKQRMVQNACGLVHKSLHNTCPKITHGVLILALGGSRGHSKSLVNRHMHSAPLPGAGRALTGVGGLGSTIFPRLVPAAARCCCCQTRWLYSTPHRDWVLELQGFTRAASRCLGGGGMHWRSAELH